MKMVFIPASAAPAAAAAQPRLLPLVSGIELERFAPSTVMSTFFFITSDDYRDRSRIHSRVKRLKFYRLQTARLSTLNAWNEEFSLVDIQSVFGAARSENRDGTRSEYLLNYI